MNCSEMFKQLDDSIFTKYGLKYTVITQHARKVDGEKLVNQYFRLNQNNILNIINSPKLFTKLSGTSTYSKLIVTAKQKKIYDEEIYQLDIREIPLPYSFDSKRIATYSKKFGLPYYANELLPRTDKFILRNIIYDEYFQLFEDGSSHIAISVNDTLYRYILTHFFDVNVHGYDTIINYLKTIKREGIKYCYISPANNSYDILVAVYVPDKQFNTINEHLFVCQTDSYFNIKNVVPVENIILSDSIKYNISLLYPVTFTGNKLVTSLFAPKTKLVNKTKSQLPTTGYFDYDSINSRYKFSQFGASLLDEYYITNQHYYTNTWLNQCEINDTIYTYFRYLNYLCNTVSGGKIILPELNSSGLKLPDYPGGDSYKPFEILNIAEVAPNVIVYTTYAKRKTTTILFNLSTHKILAKHTFNTYITPAVSYHNKALNFVIADLSGNLSLYKLNIRIAK
jgi:hypothetical protein